MTITTEKKLNKKQGVGMKHTFNGLFYSLPSILMGVSLLLPYTNPVNAEEIPPGYHRMPNGDVMANNPSKAVAPPGYRLTEGGILRKTGEKAPVSEAAAEAFATIAGVTVEEFGSIPDGYHRMPDGTLMANNPSKAVAPDGYHVMSDGTLMKDGAVTKDGMEHSKHSHKGGGMLMAEYKYQRMYMDEFLDTTNDVSHRQVVDLSGIYGYNMSSTDMSMDMHMVMLMYHTRSYMVMAMGHYMRNSMGMYVESGGAEEYSTMDTQGLADTIVTVEMPWVGFDWTLGLSLPTGSIDERGPMVHSPGSTPLDTKYPYGMQLGSGTYDVIVGLGYESGSHKLKWGAGFEYTIRTGTNDNEYTLGDKSIIDAWASYKLSSTLVQSVNFKFLEIGRISGADPELDPNMSPAADAANYGGRRLDLGLALKYETPQMTSVGIEFDLPVYQNLFGPQMKTEWILGLNAGFMF